ncbi:MAG: GNAT family N-acetyltransferase, partial [Actinomycetota bacterium]|nr:GNAT family N-acetyltransferase [Actinomycetota bacterium]
MTVLHLNDRDVELLAPLDAARLEQLRGWADRADVIDLGEHIAGFVLTFRAGTGYDSENYRWFGERFGDEFYYLDRIVIGTPFRRQGLAHFVYDTLEELA